MILVLGPYIGDFKQECILFRPHCRWLCESLDFDNVYLGTHSNRKFMYEDFIPPENILPVFENISRDEKGQQNYIHSSVSQKDYQIFVKDLKERVQDKENCIKKDMKLYNLSYIKSTPVVSIFKKLFSPVTKGFDIKTEFKDRVVYIPSNTVKKEVHSKVYKFLKRYDVIVVGDGHTRLKSENVVISKYANQLLWKSGIKNPPHHVKVIATKDEKGKVTVELTELTAKAKREIEKEKGLKKKKEEKEAEKKKKEEEAKKAEEAKKKKEEKIEEKVEEVKKEKEEKAKEIEKEELKEIKKELPKQQVPKPMAVPKQVEQRPTAPKGQ